MQWTSHKAQNHKGETSFPLKRKQKQIVNFGGEILQKLLSNGGRCWASSPIGKERTLASTFSLDPARLASNLCHRRKTCQPTGEEMKSVLFSTFLFVYLLTCVVSQSGMGKQRCTKESLL